VEQIRCKVDNRIWNQTMELIEDQICESALNQVYNQVGNQAWWQVWDQVKGHVENSISTVRPL